MMADASTSLGTLRSRAREAGAIAAVLVVVVPALLWAFGAREAMHDARTYLESDPQVSSIVGDGPIVSPVFPYTLRVSWSTAGRHATLTLGIEGSRRHGRAVVKMDGRGRDEWEVREALIIAGDETIALSPPER